MTFEFFNVLRDSSDIPRFSKRLTEGKSYFIPFLWYILHATCHTGNFWKSEPSQSTLKKFQKHSDVLYINIIMQYYFWDNCISGLDHHCKRYVTIFWSRWKRLILPKFLQGLNRWLTRHINKNFTFTISSGNIFIAG